MFGDLEAVKGDVSRLKNEMHTKAGSEDLSRLRVHVDDETRRLNNHVGNLESEFESYKRQNDEALAQLVSDFNDYKATHP